MRVLFLFPDTLEEGAYRGGVAEFLLALTPALTKFGIDSVIYTKDKSLNTLSPPRQLTDGVTIYRGPFIKPGFFFSRKKLKPVLTLCETEKIDLIHAEGTYTAGFMALQIFKRLGIPYIVTSHSDILPTNSKRMQRKSVQNRCRNVLKQAKAVTHLTPTMEIASHELLDTRAKSTLIPNGIDYFSWLPYTKLPEKNYLLAIGRLERGKGFHVLIEMYARLIEQGITTSLIIAGAGKMGPALYDQAKQLGINIITDFKDFSSIPEKSILFTGYISGETKKQLIAEAKCFLFATQPKVWEEAFGIVLLEAMAAGKALVSSDVNSARFLETLGLQASFVTPDDISEWVNATKKLLQDDSLRNLMGKNNLANAKQFDWRLIAERYKNVFLPTASRG